MQNRKEGISDVQARVSYTFSLVFHEKHLMKSHHCLISP